MINLLQIYRYIRGFLELRIYGGFPERFLNLCSKEKIYLWDTLYENGGVTTKIYCGDFYKLRKIRSKSGVSIKITNKNGLLFYYKNNKKRKILISGLAVSLVLMYIMNLFVWCIDVDDSINISKYELINAIEMQGLKFGAFTPFFDENESNRNIVNSFDGEIIWAATNIKGSKATFEARENTDKDASDAEKTTDNSPCNIVADFDGIIVSTEIYSGISNTARGNAVKHGDLLVSGVSENTDGSVNFHHSDAKLSAFHNKATEKTILKRNSFDAISVKSTNVSLGFFTLTIPLSLSYFTSGEKTIEYTVYASIGTCMLPFAYSFKTAIDRTSRENADNSVVFYVDEFTENEYTDCKNTLLINSEYTVSAIKEGYKIIAEYDCIDFIGKKSVILQEN